MFGLFKPKAESHESRTAKAVAFMRQRDYESALREVDTIISSFPAVAMSHRFRGEVLFSLERYQDAIASFDTAEKIGGPGTEEVFFWRALAHANSGQKDSALSILRSYVDSASADPELAQKCGAAISAISEASASGA